MTLSMENKEPKRSHFQPKAYRIYVMYDLAFESCANIYGKEKTDLLLMLIQSGKHVDIEKIKTFPGYTKNILAEKMLDNLKDKGKPIEELRYIFKEERILKLSSIIADKYNKIENHRPIKPLRIMPPYQEFLKTFSKERLGETLELAIALFIVESTESEYELIEFVFKTFVDNIK